MTLFEIVGLYAALNMFLLVYLTVRVIGIRRKNKIALGDGGNDILTQRIRAHGNLIEYAPMALLGLLLIASLGAAPLWLHGFGIMFTLGRVLHAYGMSSSTGASNPRVFGMLLTFATLIGEALYLLVQVIL